MRVASQGADAVRASLRLAQAIVGMVDLFQVGSLSKENATVTAAQMEADLKIVAAFVDGASAAPYFKPEN